MPDVIVVKKTYPKYRKNRRTRIFKLKHFDDMKQGKDMDMDSDEDSEEMKEQEKKPVKKVLKKK